MEPGKIDALNLSLVVCVGRVGLVPMDVCWFCPMGAKDLDRKLKERIGLKQIVDPFMSSLVKTWLVYEISTKQHPVFNLQSRRMHMATGAMRSSLWLGWSWSEIVDMVSASHWVTTLPL